jgi:hypothetical protein
MKDLSVSATPNPVCVKTICHSISPDAIPIVTQALRYPRIVHAEFMTHRVFSRNARSSRAAPSSTYLAEAADPYVPPFRLNQKGMQPGGPLSDERTAEAEAIWHHMAQVCRDGVAALGYLGVHKQWANRPLEWFGYIDVLVTSTCWANWDALRTDMSAQDEIRWLATLMKEKREASTPRLLTPGEWHLPYVTDEEVREHGGLTDPTGLLRKLSTARCARLSIKPFDGQDSLEAELARYDRLVVSRPVHASPAEHQATPDVLRKWSASHPWANPHLHGNLMGWVQHRKLIPGEAIWDSRPDVGDLGED